VYSEAKTNLNLNTAEFGYGNAALKAIQKNRPDVMKWLFENSCTQGITHLDVFELLVRQNDFELFRWLFAHVGRQDAHDMYVVYSSLLNYAPFEWIKWMISEKIGDAKVRDLWCILARRESHEECTAMIKWMVEDSGVIIDCEDWDDSSEDIPPMHVNIMHYCGTEIIEYIRSVKQMQRAAGLEKWFEGIQAKKRLDDGKQRRRL